MKLPKRIFLTLLFPVLMFLAMWAITSANPACYINGKNIFVGSDLVRFVIMNACQSICVALAIALSYLKIPIGLAFGGFGGSIDLVMVPLIV